MRNRSFQLIRTNPRLTTNIKIVVASDYNLYLESFNSCKDLSKDKYKHYLLKTNSTYEHDFPKFYDGLSKTLAYTPYTFDDVSIMYDRYENQFDEMYYSGADEVEDNWYDEEFEYFAPLYVVKNSLPSNFIIMRVDDPVIYTKYGDDYKIDSLRNDNFREEIIDKWKCITVFDLSEKTNLGKFLKRNIDNNSRFPNYSLFFDIKINNFTKFAGMKYENGVYTTSERFLNEELEKQNTHYDLETLITKGFQENGIVYPYIFNLKFLYNDTPATPDKMLKYSMNRYYGFYTDSLELVKTITTYRLPKLDSSVLIKNNIFINSKGKYVSPYQDTPTDSDWIQYKNELYEVRKQSNGAYKIISDIDLTDVSISEFNIYSCTISDNNINIVSDIIDNIDEYITEDGNKELMFADLYLIELNGEYHVLENNYNKTINGKDVTFTNNYYIRSDYKINSDNEVLRYYKGGEDINAGDTLNIYDTYNQSFDITSDVLSNINIINYYNRLENISNSSKITQNNKPLSYNIYRVNFSDIKDFDYDRVNTSYSDYDYEKSEYTETYEDKLYMTEYRDKNNPKKLKVNRFNEDGQYKKMNISSEYIADGTLYEIKDSLIGKSKSMNNMWNKTQSINKWMYKDSIGHCDYPYKLNNSYEVGGIYNRSVNTDLNISNITQKNLNYFYRIGEFYGKDNIKTFSDFGSLSDWNKEGDYDNLDFDVDSLTYSTSDENGIIITSKDDILEQNQEYFVSYNLNMLGGNKINLGNDILLGLYDTFDGDKNITYLISNSVTISFIAKALKTKLSIVIQNLKDVSISNFSINKIENKYYLNQTTNIQTSLQSKFELNNQDRRFNLEYYINSDFDYFDYFFNNKMYYQDYGKLGIKPYSKYSIFNGGTSTLPAKTLLNGIEYELYGVKDMILGDKINGKEKVNTIITSGGDVYNGYKMSVILSENYNYYKFICSGAFTTINSEWELVEITNENEDDFVKYEIEMIDNPDTDDVFTIQWDITERTFDMIINTDINPSVLNSGTIGITLQENN